MPFTCNAEIIPNNRRMLCPLSDTCKHYKAYLLQASNGTPLKVMYRITFKKCIHYEPTDN